MARDHTGTKIRKNLRVRRVDEWCRCASRGYICIYIYTYIHTCIYKQQKNITWFLMLLAAAASAAAAAAVAIYL
jgi:hypothetical protein